MDLPYVRLYVVTSGVAESPRMEAKRMDEIAAVARALNFLADLIEARGEYYYDEVEEKRWNLGDGGRAGNCDECEEAADEGWVDMDYTYDMFDQDVDGPPGHPHDT